MKAEELRMGNWLQIGTSKVRVRQLDNAIAVTGMSDYFFPDNDTLQPILLTPEILEKCGFHYNNNKSSVARLEIAYVDEDYPCTLQVSGSGIQICRNGVGAICPSVFYLHQLQNLYFTLTGTELEIKL